jgi:glycyl-tRNA synthetase
VAASSGLANAVDAFFDAVLVMTDDPETRKTRLGLLASVVRLGEHPLDWSELRL